MLLRNLSLAHTPWFSYPLACVTLPIPFPFLLFWFFRTLFMLLRQLLRLGLRCAINKLTFLLFLPVPSASAGYIHPPALSTRNRFAFSSLDTSCGVLCIVHTVSYGVLVVRPTVVSGLLLELLESRSPASPSSGSFLLHSFPTPLCTPHFHSRLMGDLHVRRLADCPSVCLIPPTRKWSRAAEGWRKTFVSARRFGRVGRPLAVTVHHRFLLEAKHVFHPIPSAVHFLSVFLPPRTRPSLMFFFVVFAAVCCLLLPVMVAIVLLPFLNFATLVVASVDDGESFCLRLSSIAIPFAHLCCIGISSSSSLFLSVSLSLGFSPLPHFSLFFAIPHILLPSLLRRAFLSAPPLRSVVKKTVSDARFSLLFSIMRYHGKVALLIHVDPTHIINDQ